MGLAAVASTRTLRQLWRKVRGCLLSAIAVLLQAGDFLPQALQCFIEMCVMDLLVLAFHTVICPDPGG